MECTTPWDTAWREVRCLGPTTIGASPDGTENRKTKELETVAKGGQDVACNSQTSAALLVLPIAGVPDGLAVIAVFTFP